MAGRSIDRRSHLVVPGTARAESFTSPAARGPKLRTRTVNRGAHGKRLLQQLERARAEIERRRSLIALEGIDAPRGFFLEFESPPGFLLKLKSLEHSPKGIELATTRQEGDREIAIVFVPQGELKFFIDRVEKYLTQLHKKATNRRTKR